MFEAPIEAVLDDLLQNAAPLVLIVMFATMLRSRAGPRADRTRRFACALGFGALAALSMLWPHPGGGPFGLDLRAIPVVLAAPLFGLPFGAITAAIAAVADVLVGGEGMAFGLAVVGAAFVLGSAVAWGRGWSLSLDAEPQRDLDAFDLALLSGLASVATLPLQLRPLTHADAVPPPWALPMALLLVIPVTTFVMGAIVTFDRRRRSLESSLRRASEQLNGIAAHLPGVIYRRRGGAGTPLKFDYVSPRSTELLGVTPEAIVADSAALTGLLHPGGSAARDAALRKLAEDPSAPMTILSKIVRPDGAIRWLEARSQVNETATREAGELISDGLILDVTERHLAERAADEASAHADWLAGHDSLTGLLSRSAALEAIARHRADVDGGLALILFDLLDQRIVNEIYGPAAGDARIIAAAQRIAAAVPKGALVARYGGDEFSILLAGAWPAAAIVDLAESVLSAMELPSSIGGRELSLSCRAGIAVIETAPASVGELLQAAELALATARERGVIGAMLHTKAMEEERAARLILRQDLADAIASDGLRLVWQPIVDASSRVVVGREALLRWDRPGFGAVPPEQFVAMAESGDLWQQLDAWVLRTACRQAVAAGESGWISVNITSSWMQAGDLVATVRRVLAETGLPAQRLWLELTERVMVEDERRAVAIVNELGRLGVGVAIDDFGAVYSSLAYLHRLPVRKIKLDRAFIQPIEGDARARTIVRAVLYLCSELSIEVIAEGVETEAQLAWLCVNGCAMVQGYLTGRPEPLLLAEGGAVAAEKQAS